MTDDAVRAICSRCRGIGNLADWKEEDKSGETVLHTSICEECKGSGEVWIPKSSFATCPECQQTYLKRQNGCPDCSDGHPYFSE